MTGYYRRFVKDYSKIAWPLTQQLKKDSFSWNEEATSAFQQLKEAMINLPVLVLPDFSKKFVIETDASGFGLGAVLMQENRPIAFYSHKLSSNARIKSVYEKELMAIVFAIKKWRPYLIGRRFIVRTDQRSLKFLLGQRVVDGEHQKWLLKLMSYDFEIQYKPGKTNNAADALSRMPEEISLAALSVAIILDFSELQEQVADDPFLSNIKQCVQKDPNLYPAYSLVGGHLRYNGKLILPSASPYIPLLLQEYHCGVVGGHAGIRRTYQRLSAEFHWKGIKRSVQNFVAACDICQRSKHEAMSPAGLLQPLPIPNQVWEDITMDFIEGLPKSQGYDSILVVVDRLTKYSHFIPLKHPFSAPSVATIFVREIVRLHGMPRSIISDRDKIFMSLFWRELFTLQGSELRRSSAYHPQTDGQSEIVNKGLETYLRCFSMDKPSRWWTWLPWAEYSYNTSFHTSAGMSPFKALYGRDPPLLVPYELGSAANMEVDKQLRQRDAILSELKAHLLRAQQKNEASCRF